MSGLVVGLWRTRATDAEVPIADGPSEPESNRWSQAFAIMDLPTKVGCASRRFLRLPS